MSVLPFKEDADFKKHNSKVLESSAEDMKEFVRDYQSLQTQLEDVKRDQKDLIVVMKSKGYDVKALREMLKRLKQDAGERAEQEEVVQLYMDLLRS